MGWMDGWDGDGLDWGWMDFFVYKKWRGFFDIGMVFLQEMFELFDFILGEGWFPPKKKRVNSLGLKGKGLGNGVYLEAHTI